MRVDTRVSRRTRQILVLPVRNVQVSLGVAVLLGETEINHVDLVAALADAHQEIVGLDVAVNKVARVDVFNARDELIGEEENSLQGEFAVAKVEEVFERGTPNLSAQTLRLVPSG
jgi:hypothetical protein